MQAPITILEVFEKKSAKTPNSIINICKQRAVAYEAAIKAGGKIEMDARKRNALEKKGFKVGSVDDFLGLHKEEAEYIELKLALSQSLAQTRKEKQLTQAQLAKMLKSCQSRVAKMEKGDPTVSVDLLVKSLQAPPSMLSGSVQKPTSSAEKADRIVAPPSPVSHPCSANKIGFCRGGCIFYCFESEAMVRWGKLVGYFHRRCKVPSYEFECDDCKNIFTVRLTLAQYEKKDYHCLKCKSKKVKQQITSFQTKTSRKS